MRIYINDTPIHCEESRLLGEKAVAKEEGMSYFILWGEDIIPTYTRTRDNTNLPKSQTALEETRRHQYAETLALTWSCIQYCGCWFCWRLDNSLSTTTIVWWSVVVFCVPPKNISHLYFDWMICDFEQRRWDFVVLEKSDFKGMIQFLATSDARVIHLDDFRVIVSDNEKGTWLRCVTRDVLPLSWYCMFLLPYGTA